MKYCIPLISIGSVPEQEEEDPADPGICGKMAVN